MEGGTENMDEQWVLLFLLDWAKEWQLVSMRLNMLRIVTWGLELGRILWNDLICDQNGEKRWTVLKTGVNLWVL